MTDHPGPTLPEDPAAWTAVPAAWPDGAGGWRLVRPDLALAIKTIGPETIEVGILQTQLSVAEDGRLRPHEIVLPRVAFDMAPDRLPGEDPLAWALRAAAMAAGAPAHALQEALQAIARAWAAEVGMEVFVGADVAFDLSAVRTDGSGDRLLRQIPTSGALRQALVLLATPARRQRPPRGWRLDVRAQPPATAHVRAAVLADARAALGRLPPALAEGLADLLPPGA